MMTKNIKAYSKLDLQGLGTVGAIKTEDLQSGMLLCWNGGYASYYVKSIEQTSKCFYTMVQVDIKTGVEYSSRYKIDRLIGVATDKNDNIEFVKNEVEEISIDEVEIIPEVKTIICNDEEIIISNLELSQAKGIIKNKIEASTNDFNDYLHKYGCQYHGKNQNIHALDIIANENLKNISTFKIQDMIQKYENKNNLSYDRIMNTVNKSGGTSAMMGNFHRAKSSHEGTIDFNNNKIIRLKAELLLRLAM